MKHLLSDKAKKKRREDFLRVAGELSIIGVAVLYLVGAALLVHQEAHQYVKKLNGPQRAVLAALTIIAGGALIVMMMNVQLWGLALVVMFLLGWLLSEISRL